MSGKTWDERICEAEGEACGFDDEAKTDAQGWCGCAVGEHLARRGKSYMRDVFGALGRQMTGRPALPPTESDPHRRTLLFALDGLGRDFYRAVDANRYDWAAEIYRKVGELCEQLWPLPEPEPAACAQELTEAQELFNALKCPASVPAPEVAR